MRLAIFPARGGSKRIPKKNILGFCGKPMIAHPLEAARDSGLFDEIHVSTDIEEVRKAVEGAGFEVAFMRDASLADDHTSIMPVLKWVLEKYKDAGRVFDDVCLVMPCSPLIEPEDFKACFQIYEENKKKNPLLTVAEYPVPVEWAFTRESSGKLTPCQPGAFAIRSQDLDKKYYDAGSIAIFPAAHILSEEPHTEGGFVSYVMPKDKVVDIDEPADLKKAKALYLSRRSGGSE
jgi:N-acylneuraminate cytidylyltransferase